jgi:hypothetical protein
MRRQKLHIIAPLLTLLLAGSVEAQITRSSVGSDPLNISRGGAF